MQNGMIMPTKQRRIMSAGDHPGFTQQVEHLLVKKTQVRFLNPEHFWPCWQLIIKLSQKFLKVNIRGQGNLGNQRKRFSIFWIRKKAIRLRKGPLEEILAYERF